MAIKFLRFSLEKILSIIASALYCRVLDIMALRRIELRTNLRQRFVLPLDYKAKSNKKLNSKPYL